VVLFAVIHGAALARSRPPTGSGSIKPLPAPAKRQLGCPKPKKKTSPTVRIARADGIVIKFKETLRTATTQNGPWQDDKSAKSPLTVTLNGHEKFFRSR
jgi:hypothetical protein